MNKRRTTVIGELIRSGQFITNTRAPSSGQGLQGEIGDYFYFEVTATARGPIWGMDVYTLDSSITSATVHAGVLRGLQSVCLTWMIVASNARGS